MSDPTETMLVLKYGSIDNAWRVWCDSWHRPEKFTLAEHTVLSAHALSRIITDE